jgi:DNA-directed RNA polymerase subunit RPC12/RpoP
MKVKFKPKNYRCIKCEREQYTNERCFGCGRKVFVELKQKAKEETDNE